MGDDVFGERGSARCMGGGEGAADTYCLPS